ncbi:MAG: hypothetical protein V4641_09685, partial [Pseudomonadota bacterium]
MSPISLVPPPAAPAAMARRAGRWLLLLTLQALLLAWLFRANWANGWTWVLGDRYDSLIEVSILEHWFNTLRGLAQWSSVNYFYPYSNTLGYNDGYLAYGLIYSAARAAGADMLISAMVVNMVMKAAGFGAFYLCARRMLGLGFGYALLGAAIFELSNNLALHALHAQLLAVAFVPLAALLLHGAVGAALRNAPRALLCHGAAFAVLYGLWAMTAYYMLWFFSFYTLLFLGAMALLRPGLRERLKAAPLKTVPAVGD